MRVRLLNKKLFRVDKEVSIHALVRAVSYTHLDVYKRQPFPGFKNFNSFIFMLNQIEIKVYGKYALFSDPLTRCV